MKQQLRIPVTLLVLLVPAALVAPVAAHAQGSGFSTDIELVRPTFSPRSTLGVDSPFTGGEGTLDIGAQLQYQRDPLRLIEFDEVTGAVVRHRVMAQLGMAWAPSDRVSLRASLPMAIHRGGEIEEIRGDGFGTGDLSAGVRYQFVEGSGFTLGAHGDLTLNVGTRNKYLGEAQPRTAFGLLAAGEEGPVLVLANLGVQTRSTLDTNRDFQLGNELTANVAGILTLPGEVAAVHAGLISRWGMARLFQGGAESSVEWTAGAQVPMAKGWRLDVGVGRGLTAGYGTTAYRGLLGIRYETRPEPPAPPPPDFVVDIIDIPEDEPDDEPPPDPPPEPPPDGWRPGELARKVGEVIEIKDPIQFEFGTSRILPVSLPMLKQVAGLVNTDGRIGHLLIEGHASEEGSFAYNYDLSIRRAKAVFEQLTVLGVHPHRMSYRGMGEVVPLSEASDEAALAKNRRVEFEIIKQYAPGDVVPDLDKKIQLMWSGDAAEAQIPPPLPEPRRRPTDLLEGSDGNEDLLRPTPDPAEEPAAPAPTEKPTAPEEAP